MIWVNEGRDQAGIKLMRRAGLDSKQYISVSNESTRLHAMNIETGEFVIIEKKTAEIVKKYPVLWRAIRDTKITFQAHYRANIGGKSSEIT